MGFLEAGLRSHADGCDTAHPVGFIEGWFVNEKFRKRGISRALDAGRRRLGSPGKACTEIASDTWIDDERSQNAHKATVGVGSSTAVSTFASRSLNLSNNCDDCHT